MKKQKKGERKIPGKEKRKEFLEQHFYYEVLLMRDAGKMIIQAYPNPISDHVKASFLLHIRNLYEFFYGYENPRVRDDTALAIDHEGWEAKSVPEDIGPYHKPLHIFLSHLSYERDSEELTNRFPLLRLYNHFRMLTMGFLEKIDEEYPDSLKLKELKELLKN